MRELWLNLPNGVQDALVLGLGLLPALALGLWLMRGYAPGALIRALISRHRWPIAAFVTLISISVAMGVAILAQERGLRVGSAAAADKFDMVITPPGGEVSMMLAAVYLQPTDAGLIDGDTFVEISESSGVTMAAPLAFGDSVDGHPVVGTTQAFVEHLTETSLPDWTGEMQAYVGADTDFEVGQILRPVHGVGDAAEDDPHDADIEVIARMPPTGSPWDRAVITPVESVWSIHGLANGHAPDSPTQLGAPFDARFFPGTPAVIVTSDSLSRIYALRSRYTREGQTMAFFPGAVLSELHGLLGDVRRVMSVMALITQGLVALAVFLGLFILSQLFRRQMAVLRALGAPGRFVAAVIWGFAMTLVVVGAALGLILGIGATAIVSGLVSQATGLDIPARLGWTEVQLIAGFVGLAGFAALLPAWGALRRSVVDGLRGGN